jgi:trans-aconitate methyltransferase
MTPLEPKGPNAEQIKFWNEAGIAYYFAHKDAIKAERAPLTRRLIERATPAAAERALDIGCGFGDLTMELARRIGSSGFAVGIDLSSALLEKAAEAARIARLGNIRFENLDVQAGSDPNSCSRTYWPGRER